MHQTVEFFAATAFAVIGLSHLLRPREWVDFFVRLRSTGDAGVFQVAILHMLPGVLIAATHNVWSGLGIILTIIGWGWIIKATLYFNFPAIGRWTLGRLSVERAYEFRVAGIVLLGISAALFVAATRA